MHRRPGFIGFALTAVIFALISAGERSEALSADKAPKTTSKAWDQILEVGKREGTVVIYGPRQLGFRPILGDEFSKAYPDIQSRWVFNTGGDIGQRILTERRANRYIPDLLIGGSSTAVRTLKPAGALAPLRPLLFLPEVLDESNWLQNRLWWTDESEPNTTLTFTGYVNAVATFNTKLVKADQFRSYFDLLNPRWKGKIAGRDVRQTGPGSDGIRFIYHHPDLGPRFLERLFSEMEITLSSNQSQLMDWVAQGRFPIALFLPSADIMRAQGQGLPVAPMPMRQFKEGVSISSGAGSVSVMGRAPHPNAAVVFLNWLLSREGQSAWQRAISLPSLRTDISKSELDPTIVVGRGVKAIDVGTEKFILSEPEIRRVITKALEKGR